MKINNYGLKPKFKPACHIILPNGKEYLIVETSRTIDTEGKYKIDYSLYEIHDGKADTLLGKGNNPAALEKKYIKY